MTTRVQVIKRDKSGDSVRFFENDSSYEKLNRNEVVECEDAKGQITEYYVSEMKWDFSHFGETLIIILLPTN